MKQIAVVVVLFASMMITNVVHAEDRSGPTERSIIRAFVDAYVLNARLGIISVQAGCEPDASNTCWNIDEGTGGTSTGGTGSTPCNAATSYDTCMSRCVCEYNNNTKKCGSNTFCLGVALAERNACYGNCTTDFL